MIRMLFAAQIALLLGVGSNAAAQDYRSYDDNGDYFECRRGARLSGMAVDDTFGYSFGRDLSGGRTGPWESNGSVIVSFANDPGLRVFGLPVTDSFVSWHEGVETRWARIDATIETVIAAVRVGYPGIRLDRDGDEWNARLGHSASRATGVGPAELHVDPGGHTKLDGTREEYVLLRCRAPMFVPDGAGYSSWP